MSRLWKTTIETFKSKISGLGGAIDLYPSVENWKRSIGQVKE